MGIEKLIPRAADLAGLPAPARALGDGPGDHRLHLALPRPAPGRRAAHRARRQRPQRAARATRRSASALACIRCGACLNTCPVYRRSGGHSYGATVAGPDRLGARARARSRDATRACRTPAACAARARDVCPVKIDLHAPAARLARGAGRPSAARGRALHVGSRARRGSCWSARALFALAGSAARTLGRALPERWLTRPPTLWTRGRALPALPRASFRALYAKRSRARE